MTTRADTAALLEQADASLLDLVDNVLTKGIVIDGEIMLGLANVDLVYLRLRAILCAADRVKAAMS
jgi:gas vesicle protein GvpA/GvpJ/GvpM family